MNSSSYSHSADYSLIQNACGEILLWPKHADLIKSSQVSSIWYGGWGLKHDFPLEMCVRQCVCDSMWSELQPRTHTYMHIHMQQYHDDKLSVAVSVHKWRNLRPSPYSQREENLTTPLPSFIPFLTPSLIRSPGFSWASKQCSEERGIPNSNRSLSPFFSLPLCLSFVAYRGLWFVWHTVETS